MKKTVIFLLAILALSLGAQAVQAACYAEYKAKRDNPLELFYDVAKVGGDCTIASATQKLNKQLAKQGLTLLKVLSVKEK